jgi:Protein of unknown function (DUF2934)
MPPHSTEWHKKDEDRARMTEHPPRTLLTWDQTCFYVRDEMAKYVSRLVTPISLSDSPDRGSSCATGNYLTLRDVPYLLTNEHVVGEAVGYDLAHLPGPTDDYVLCNNAWLAAAWPMDIALMRLGQAPAGPDRDSVSACRLGVRYSPVPQELLFWIGFPGSTAKRHDAITELNTRRSWFGSLVTPANPVLTQELPVAPTGLPRFDANRHVALYYPAAALRTAEQPLTDTPNPKGMSGSLLWDTKFVANARSRKRWNSASAEVCGVLWAAHSKPEVVVATKIEHVRSELLHFLREECAYFHWINRGRPPFDALTDWLWAEQSILDLGE